MRFSIITIFPQFFDSPLRHGLLDKALSDGKVQVEIHNLRDFAKGRHRQTDDEPYGGGPGMVMMPAPLAKAITHAKKASPNAKILALSPAGRPLTDELARELAREKEGFVFVCGRYEGIDQRIIDHYCDGEISVGDYVLTGGEPAALILIDAISRHIPDVIGDPESVARDSFAKALAHPQYTRPANFEGYKVPSVLTSGHKEKVKKWRTEAARLRTMADRPELLMSFGSQKFWIALSLSSDSNKEIIYQEILAVKALDQLAGAYDLGGVVAFCNNIDVRNRLREAEFSSGIYIKSDSSNAIKTVEKKSGSAPLIIELTNSQMEKAISIDEIKEMLTVKNSPSLLFLSTHDQPIQTSPRVKLDRTFCHFPKSILSLPLATKAAIILDRIIG